MQRVFQLMGWQVRKRPIGFRPRIQALPSVATMPNERWSTDLVARNSASSNASPLRLFLRNLARDALRLLISSSRRMPCSRLLSSNMLDLVGVGTNESTVLMFFIGPGPGMECFFIYSIRSMTSTLPTRPFCLTKWPPRNPGRFIQPFGATLDGAGLFLNGAWRTNENAQP
ncbi:hypothetical protein [Bordetella sp. 2513F-2]